MQIVNVRKSRIALAVLLLLAGAGIAGVILSKNSAKRTISVTSLVEEAAQTTSFQNKNTNLIKDSDNDGLLDWEEKVYGTDPNNPDTDGDGTTDGEEIKQHRDPLVAGPNDGTGTQASGASALSNLTELLAQELSGVLNDPGVNLKLPNVEETISNIDLYSPQGFKKTFTAALTANRAEFEIPPIPDTEIRISDAPGTGMKYAQSVVFIVERNIKSLPKELPQALADAVENAEYDDLAPYVSAYQRTAAEVKVLAVPPQWQEAQKKQIGLFLALSRIADAVQHSPEDPLKGALALSVTPRIMATQGDILEQIWRNTQFVNQ